VFGSQVNELGPATLAVLEGEVPTASFDRGRLDRGGDLVGLLVEAGVVASKSEGLRLLDQRGLSINDDKLDGAPELDRTMLLHDRWLVVRRGRRQVHLLCFDAG
jgi:tyrosyl-tRNA synthetase